jgi:hypothetical protein
MKHIKGEEVKAEVKVDEEIVAYRIGEGLFCPDCYEEGARTLKAVQNPEDPQVTFPAKAIRSEDLSIFICQQCKTVKGPSARESKIQSKKAEEELSIRLTDQVDEMEHIRCKLRFVEESLTQTPPDRSLELSNNAISGLYWILNEVEEGIEKVSNEIEAVQDAMGAPITLMGAMDEAREAGKI